MKLKKVCSFLLICAIMAGYLNTSAKAYSSDILYLEDVMYENLGESFVTRASGTLNAEIAPNSIITINESFTMSANGTIKYNCTYTPKTASLDFGIVDSNNHFHYLNVTTGSINKTIRVSQGDTYTLAIRNNSDQTVTVTGTVNY